MTEIDEDHPARAILLTAEQIVELLAIGRTCEGLGHTFLHKCHWKLHRRLVQSHLITWRPFEKGEMGDPFRKITVTTKGVRLIAWLKEQEAAKA